MSQKTKTIRKSKSKLNRLRKIKQTLLDLSQYYWENEDVSTARQVEKAACEADQAISLHELPNRIKLHRKRFQWKDEP